MGDEAQAQIDSLRERLAAAEAVAAEVARIKAINADLEARNALLELQNEKMRRTLFGQRSEHVICSIRWNWLSRSARPLPAKMSSWLRWQQRSGLDGVDAPRGIDVP